MWWMDQLGERRKADRSEYTRATVHTSWAVLRAMLRDAMVLAGLERDPTAGVRFRVRGALPRERDALTVDEIAAFLHAAEEESFDIQVMLWLGFTTGARFGELTALTWDDVDLERGAVTIRHSQSRVSSEPPRPVDGARCPCTRARPSCSGSSVVNK
jgi:integrase